jgi:hypothetical protein
MERQAIDYGGGACHGLMQMRADQGYVIPECAGIWEIRYERAQGSVAREPSGDRGRKRVYVSELELIFYRPDVMMGNQHTFGGSSA